MRASDPPQNPCSAKTTCLLRRRAAATTPKKKTKSQHNKNWRRRHITPSRTDKSPGPGPLERGLQQRPQLAREVVAAEHLLVGRVAVLVQQPRVGARF